MMKNRYRGISVLVTFLMLAVSGCGRNVSNSRDEISVNLSTENNDPNVEVVLEGESEGTTTNQNEDSVMAFDGEVSSEATDERTYARFSGCFTATVEELLPDYYALPGKTIAVVHYFQDRPFLLRFQEDMSDELTKGETYIFEFDTFDVEIPRGVENVDISDYMYSIVITSYRPAEEGEIGLGSLLPTVEIIYY